MSGPRKTTLASMRNFVNDFEQDVADRKAGKVQHPVETKVQVEKIARVPSLSAGGEFMVHDHPIEWLKAESKRQIAYLSKKYK